MNPPQPVNVLTDISQYIQESVHATRLLLPQLNTVEWIGVFLALWGIYSFVRAGYYDNHTSYEDVGQIILTFGWLLYIIENTAHTSGTQFWESVATYSVVYLLVSVLAVKACLVVGETCRAIKDGDFTNSSPTNPGPAYNHLDTFFDSSTDNWNISVTSNTSDSKDVIDAQILEIDTQKSDSSETDSDTKT